MLKKMTRTVEARRIGVCQSVRSTILEHFSDLSPGHGVIRRGNAWQCLLTENSRG